MSRNAQRRHSVKLYQYPAALVMAKLAIEPYHFVATRFGLEGDEVPENLSRNALLVKFFAQAYPGIPRKHLVKFIYEADVLAREYLGHAVSTLAYRRYKLGPYDPAIEEAIKELIDAGHVEEKRDTWRFKDVFGAYKRLMDQHHPVVFDFALGESAVLDYVVTNYLDMPIEEFLHDVIYETAPMKAVSRSGELLPMAVLDNAGTKRVGFRLDEVLRAEEAGRRGEYVTLTAFVDELRSEAPA